MFIALSKYQAQPKKFKPQINADSAQICDYVRPTKFEAGDPRYRLPLLNLTHLLRGGQVRAGVYSCFEFLATIPASMDRSLYKKDLAIDKQNRTERGSAGSTSRIAHNRKI
jgi:hypothetical protein